MQATRKLVRQVDKLSVPHLGLEWILRISEYKLLFCTVLLYKHPNNLVIPLVVQKASTWREREHSAIDEGHGPATW